MLMCSICKACSYIIEYMAVKEVVARARELNHNFEWILLLVTVMEHENEIELSYVNVHNSH